LVHSVADVTCRRDSKKGWQYPVPPALVLHPKWAMRHIVLWLNCRSVRDEKNRTSLGPTDGVLYNQFGQVLHPEHGSRPVPLEVVYAVLHVGLLVAPRRQTEPRLKAVMADQGRVSRL
jgi:hypothetical protein